MGGEEVKKILQRRGYKLSDVAKEMGETPQNFQAMLKVADIKTGTLERICKAIKHDIFFFFDVNDDIPGYKRPENPVEDLVQASFDINLLQQTVSQMEDHLKDKDKIIKVLEKHIEVLEEQIADLKKRDVRQDGSVSDVDATKSAI